MTETPEQTPEGILIGKAAEDSGRSIRRLAAEAGMSDTRWRQVVKGFQTVDGTVAAAVAPARTLAKMAAVLGIAPQQLADAGRSDAATVLERMASEPARSKPDCDEPRGLPCCAVPRRAGRRVPGREPGSTDCAGDRRGRRSGSDHRGLPVAG